MSSRTGYTLAVLLLLIAAGLRFWDLTTLPPGLHNEEIIDIRIIESVRGGRIEVFYDLTPLGAAGGREGLYHTLLAVTTSFTGGGLLGYRMVSVLAGMLTLAVTYAMTTRLFGPLAGVAALGLLALGFWPVLLSRQIGPEALLPLLSAGVLLALARAFPVYQRAREGEPSTGPYAALGLLLGAGFYIHPTNFLILLLSIIFITYMVASPYRLSRRTLSYIGFALVLVAITSMPYLISSIRLPDLSGVGRIFGDYSITAHPPLETLLQSFNGVFFFGDTNAAHNLPGRPLVDLVSGVVMLVGLLATLRNWRRPRYTLLLVALAILTPAAFLTANSPDFSAFAALLPVLALLFGLGITTLYNTLRGPARALLLVGLVALLGFNLAWTVNDLFNRWPQDPATQQVFNGRLGQLAHYIDTTSDTLPTLICTPRLASALPEPELSEAQILSLMLHSRQSTLRIADCGTGLVLADGGGPQQVVFTDAGTLDTTHPYLRDWLMQGEPVQSEILPPDGVLLLDVADELADKIGLFTTTNPVRYAPEAPGGPAERFPPVAFGGNITFLGYEPDMGSTYEPDGIVTTITYWRVDGPLPRDMRLFTHILSDPAAIVAQNTGISVLPATLARRDVLIQVTFVTLPPAIPTGTHALSIGAYQDSDNMRMDVLDAEGASRGNRLFLPGHMVTVTAGEAEE